MSNTNPSHSSSAERPCNSCGCTRRKFLAGVTYALTGVIGVIVTVPIIGFIVAPIFRQKAKVWRDVGAVDSFTIGTTRLVEYEDASSLRWAGVTARSAAWVRRDSEDQFTCFSVNCTHLGCPVRWDGQADLFMCPCHGGVYYKSGEVAAGPPPKALPRYPVRVRNGKVEVQPSPVPISRFYI